MYPTEDQKVLLSKHFGCARFVYNHFLDVNQEHYKTTGKNLSFAKWCLELTTLKTQTYCKWLNEVNAQSIQRSLKDLDIAYKNFFKKGSKPPAFKKKNNNQSFGIPQGIGFNKTRLQIPKFREGIKTVFDRPIQGKVKSATVSKTPSNKYFVSILCEVPSKLNQKPKTNKQIGIDLGIKDFITLSNGEKIKNPNFNRNHRIKLKRAQQNLSRKTKGSKRYEKQRVKVARIHEKITNSRVDFQQKLSTKLINEYDLIALESLNVAGMVKNHSLAYSISDSAWYSFTAMLEYKARWYGKSVVRIDRFYPSSKTCSCCDFILDRLPLQVRSWNCPSCNETHDRDINAAKNILRQGKMSLLRDDTNVCSAGCSSTNTERTALASSNRGETGLDEVLKKRGVRKYLLKPFKSSI